MSYPEDRTRTHRLVSILVPIALLASAPLAVASAAVRPDPGPAPVTSPPSER